MENKQQKGRDNNTQIQVENVNYGLSVDDVTKMFEQEHKLLIAQMQLLAKEEMDKRLTTFGEKTLNKIIKADVIDSFSDPAIQLFLRSASKAAVSSDRELDYDILGEILISRIENKDNYTKKAALQKAVDCISLISDEALFALTLLSISQILYPTGGMVEDGMRNIDSAFKNIINDKKLPEGREWIENLEIAGVLTSVNFTMGKKLEDIYYDFLTGYYCVGIQKDSKIFFEAVEKLTSVSIPSSILFDNTLFNGYVRLPLYILKNYDGLTFSRKLPDGTIENIPFNREQINVLNWICDNYDNNSESKKLVKNKYLELVNNFPYLSKVIDWYDQYIQPSLTINQIGKIIAQCNAKVLDDNIPNIN